MGIFKTELDSQTKLLTALAFGELQATEPFLNSARAIAYSHSATAITMSGGKAVAQEFIQGKQQSPAVLDFANAAIGPLKSIDYDVSVNGVKRAHVDMSADLFGSGTTLKVNLDGNVLNGRCDTDKGIMTCEETIKDSRGHLLLRGHIMTDVYKNMADFKRTTDYTGPNGRKLGSVSQHVKYMDKASTMVAETWVSLPK